MAIIEPSRPADPSRITIEDVRQKAGAIILLATNDLARVHTEWKLKADIGREASILKRKSDLKIHCWMIGTASLPVQKSANGSYDRIGARTVSRELELVLWGFYDYTLFDEANSMSSQKFCEEECELIGDYFAANPRLDFDSSKKGLSEVKPFDILNIDVHSFGEGVDCHVAQCSMKVVLKRY